MSEQTPSFFDLSELVELTELTGYTVVRHGYREARVIGEDVIARSSYSSGDELDHLQHRLAVAAGSRADNHECYEVTNLSGQMLCLWFSDWKLVVGTATQPYS